MLLFKFQKQPSSKKTTCSDVFRRFSASAETTPTKMPNRDLIGEYLARNCAPPAILKPSFQAFSPPPQLELAYKHPRLLLEDEDEIDVLSTTGVHSSIYTETNREIEIKYVEDNSIELLDASEKNGRRGRSSVSRPNEKRNAFHSIELDTSPLSSVKVSQCKLIGNVKPNLIKTWEQLNKNQLYHVNHVVHASESSEDFYDSIDDQFISELNDIPSMCGDDEDGSSSMVTASGTAAGEGMAQYESLDKRKFAWSIESDKILV